MFEKILKKSDAIKEANFEYYILKKNYDITINFIQQGTKISPHSHDQEVFNYVFNGEFSIFIDDTEKSYFTGDWIYIPMGKIHSVETKTEVILLELWKK